MMRPPPFSMTEPALRGFRLVRERPHLLVALMIFSVLLAAPADLGLDMAVSRVLPANFTFVDALRAGDAARYAGLIGRLAPLLGLALFYQFILFAIVAAAINRAIFVPSAAAFGYLRLGADEIRQLLLVAAIFLILAGVYLAFMVPASIVTVAAGGLAGAAGSAGAIMLVMAVLLAAIIAVAVRLSLASPLTFATHRLTIARSWRMTRGLGWRIAGVYALASLLAIVVRLLGLAIVVAVTALVGGGIEAAAEATRWPAASAAAWVTPARAVYMALSGVLSALVWPVVLAPAAAICQALSEPHPGARR